jgi:pyruvate formate lyase activating enzyme
MHIAGFTPNSFVDFPDGIAAVVFLGGCNFDCWYCHNKKLINSEDWYSEDEILKRIEKHKKMLDGVVIPGGEPTLQNTSELTRFILEIKAMGLSVKLDTNGTNSNALKKLLPYLDYVAMDIKAPINKYEIFTKICENQIEEIKKSIELLINNIECEFRTTFAPPLTKEDIYEIAETLKGCKHYYLQQYVPTELCRETKAYSADYLKETCGELKTKGYPCEVRGI